MRARHTDSLKNKITKFLPLCIIFTNRPRKIMFAWWTAEILHTCAHVGMARRVRGYYFLSAAHVATHMGPTCDGRVIVYLKATAANVILGLSNYQSTENNATQIYEFATIITIPFIRGVGSIWPLRPLWEVGPTKDAGPLQYNTLKFYQTFRMIYWRCLVLMSNKFMIGDFEFWMASKRHVS